MYEEDWKRMGKDIDHLFHMASEVIEADRLHLFLHSDGTRIDEDEYLSSLEGATELIVCTEEQFQKLYDAWLLSGWLLFQNNFDEYLLK